MTLGNETDDRPRDVVLSDRRRNETSSVEDDQDTLPREGGLHFFDIVTEAIWVFVGELPVNNGSDLRRQGRRT